MIDSFNWRTYVYFLKPKDKKYFEITADIILTDNGVEKCQ